jgi:hypothetical protein
MRVHTVDPASGRLPHDLVTAIEHVYEPAGMKVTLAPMREAESSEYGACRFGLDGRAIAFRVAKTTPTKLGQFVTIWKRPTPNSEIVPIDITDGLAFVVVSVFDRIRRGQFVFSQQVLVEKGIMSRSGKGGKRAIRVYPPWTNPVVSEATKTQRWQIQYFVPLAEDGSAEPALVRRLFNG